MKEGDDIYFNIKLSFNVIFKNEINKIGLNKYDYATIFGKGPSFKIIEKKSNELRCAINQASNIAKDVDFLCMNDHHNLFKIDLDTYKNLKYLLIPEYLHIDGKFNKKGHWFKVYDYLKDKFNGEIIIFNLRTCKYKNTQFIDIPRCKTTSNVAVNFICIFLNSYIKEINTYGIGIISNKNYNEKKL